MRHGSQADTSTYSEFFKEGFLLGSTCKLRKGSVLGAPEPMFVDGLQFCQ